MGDWDPMKSKRKLVAVPNAPRGFTLIELLIVLGIIGLLLGISVPALSGLSQRTRLKTTTRQLLGLLTLARSLAISSHEPHAVKVDAARGVVTVENLTTRQALEQRLGIPPSITIQVQQGGEPAPKPEVVFQPTGSLIGRSLEVVVADRTRSQALSVSAITGAVLVRQAAPEAQEDPEGSRGSP